jgi:Xaa-Pro aminopeptidase
MGPDAVALVPGARMQTRSRDTDFPFRQDSDFWYLTGFDHPNAVAVLRTDGGPPYTLYVEPRDREAETWTGYRPGVEGAKRDHEADEAHEIARYLEHLPELVRRARRLYHVLGRDPAADARIVETLETLRLRSRQGAEPAEALLDPRSLIHPLRLFKEPAELDILRRGAEITREAHEAGARLGHAPNWEYEVEAAIEYAFRRRGARGPAYTTIVGGGRNATVLHYVRNDQKLQNGDLMLVDAGCELEYYASDVTRTYPVGGRFGGAGREVYEVVWAAQRDALAECRPGRTLADVHAAAVRRLTRGMLDLGLLEGDVASLVANESYRKYYMHMTSHWIGLDVHDVGSYRVDGEHRVLEPGLVFSVEPGLYIGADDESADPRLRGIGVRIEDDVVITADGHENLTAAVPTAPEDLEALVSER